MTRQWLGYTSERSHGVVREALRSFSPSGRLKFVGSASELRMLLRDEEPGSVGAIIGFCARDVSDINLAAAIVADGLAEEVVLVARGVTGSLRSRAACAGISRVIDVMELSLSARAETESHRGEEGRSAQIPARAEGKERHALSLGSRQVRAPIVTFVSGRGGLGKSTLVAVMAAAAGRWGLRVALCDLDLSNGNLYECVGLRKGMNLADMVIDGALDREGVCKAGLPCLGNVLLWGPCDRPEMAEVVAPATGDLLASLASSYDLVLVDTSTTCTDAVAQAMQYADRLVIVHGQELLGMSSAARTSALAVRLGIARTRIVRVENGCAARDVGQPFMPRAEVGLEAARAFRVVDGGEEVGALVRSGGVQELSELDNDFTQTTLSFGAQLFEELGCLPDCDEAHRLAKGPRRKGGFSFFGRRREAV